MKYDLVIQSLEMIKANLLDLTDHDTVEIFNDLIDHLAKQDYEGAINGWRYYRNIAHGKMVAYYPAYDGEQMIFDTDEAFERWLEAERNEF